MNSDARFYCSLVNAVFRKQLPPLLVFLLILVLDASSAGRPAGSDDPESKIMSRRIYRDAVNLSEKKPGKGEDLFQKLVDDYPDLSWSQLARRWLGDNKITSVQSLIDNGPAGNTIDVAIMGDGFTHSYTDRNQFRRLAAELIKEYMRSEVLEEYASYFNFHLVMLASREDRIDFRKHEYDTALDAKKSGDGRHVYVDRDRVRYYLQACEWSDQLAFVIIREGGLGTGGGGVATVGKDIGPVVIHEWGHAFAGLADEYSNDARSVGSPARGPNISSSPDPRLAPWAVWHKRYPTKFKAHEGGAGVYKGVWRPTPDKCVMRAGHDFCEICREAIILRIYSHVEPVHQMTPNDRPIEVTAGDEKAYLDILPLLPKSHRLKVRWSVVPEGDRYFDGRIPGRGAIDLPGSHVAGKVRTKGGRKCHFLEIQDLVTRRKIGSGRYRIFAQVSDPAVIKGKPAVLNDPRGILYQNVSWEVVVAKRPAAPPPAVDLSLTIAPSFNRGRLDGLHYTQEVRNRTQGKVRFIPLNRSVLFGASFDDAAQPEARDGDGNPLVVKAVGEGGFEVASEGVGRFSCTWKRELVPDGAGKRAGPLLIDSGGILYDLPDVFLGRFDCAWHLPPGWSVVAPWPLLVSAFRLPSHLSGERNVVCLGNWNTFESRTKHVLLRTAVSPRFEGDGKRLNTLCNRALTAAGDLLPLPANDILLIALEPEGKRWEAVLANDSLLVRLPHGIVPLSLEGEADFLEFMIRQIILHYSPEPRDSEAAHFFESSARLLAVGLVKESGARDSNWYNTRAASLLVALESPGPLFKEAEGFAAAFFLDQALRRLAGSDRTLGGFFTHLAAEGRPAGGAQDPLMEKTFTEIMDALSGYAGFDVLPFWKRYQNLAGGIGVEGELTRCGLVLKRVRDRHILANMK